MHDIYSCNLVI